MTQDEFLTARRSSYLAAALIPTVVIISAFYFLLTDPEPGGKITLLVMLGFIIWVPQMLYLIGHAMLVARGLPKEKLPSQRA